jgi:hypothetical protein
MLDADSVRTTSSSTGAPNLPAPSSPNQQLVTMYVLNVQEKDIMQ